jgi:sugar phosphate isomerase/epimerase
MNTISFISANYVARALGYNGDENWGTHDTATVAAASPEHFSSIAHDVKAAGFNAIDIWMGHCHFRNHNAALRDSVKNICAEHGLQITSYAGGLNAQSESDVDELFAFASQLGAPIFAGGIHGAGADPALINDIAQKHGVRWAFENHPEKSADEILARIGGGKFEHCGVAFDTGWSGTQGLDALETVKAIREKLFILHLKDVVASGGHDTCVPGDGVVNGEGVVRYLVETGWQGTICIEHEPYDRDPMPEVITGLQRLQQWLQP